MNGNAGDGQKVRLTQGVVDKERTFVAWMTREYPSFGVELVGDDILVNKDCFDVAMPMWRAYFNGWYDGCEVEINNRLREVSEV